MTKNRLEKSTGAVTYFESGEKVSAMNYANCGPNYGVFGEV
jgi:hypothetical protein